MKKLIRNAVLFSAILSTPACLGQMGLTKEATDINLKIVDNRYARAGIYLLASPVYAFCGTLDLLLFNSIEFWTGTNPVTGQSPALADTDADAWMKVD